MRISDWSSDVCSADLQQADAVAQGVVDAREALLRRRRALRRRAVLLGRRRGHGHVASRTALRNWRVRSSFRALKRSSGRPSSQLLPPSKNKTRSAKDPKSALEGKRVATPVATGGPRTITNKHHHLPHNPPQ